MTTDYRDLVISDLADSEALLHERVLSLEQDVEVYREMTQVLLTQMTEQVRCAKFQTAQIADLVAEIRTLRAKLLRGAIAA